MNYKKTRSDDWYICKDSDKGVNKIAIDIHRKPLDSGSINIRARFK